MLTTQKYSYVNLNLMLNHEKLNINILTSTTKIIVILPNFQVLKFCGKAQFPHIARESIRKLCLTTKCPHQEIRWNWVFFCGDCLLGSKNGILGVKLEYRYTSGYQAGFEVWFILYTANKTSWYWNIVLLLTLMCQSVLTNTIN